MTIPQLLADESFRWREFPVAVDKRFFAHAGVCPLPARVAEAIRQYTASCTLGDQETLVPAFRIKETRQLAARLIGADISEIAFVGPTSLALSYIASGVQFKAGDNLIAYFDDYPSNVYPWMALAEKGVEVRFLKTPEFGKITIDDVRAAVDSRTRLVALASNHYIAGWRIDLDAIGSFLRERGILFSVDAIQTVGAFPTSTKYIDFLAADAHKWLLGPCAAGILFVRKEIQEQFRPPIYGWHNVIAPGFVAQDTLKFWPDSRRYEAGSDNLLGLVGLHTSMEMLLEVGIESISRELLRKRAFLVEGLRSRGYTVLCADAPPEHASSITSFYKDGVDLPALHKNLEQRGIVTSLRGNRHGQNFLRISPHLYNTDTELSELMAAL